MPSTRSQTARAQAEKYKECEQMVQKLRVVELRKILQFFKASHVGQKTDLQSRILASLRTNLELLAPKIQEVYAQFAQEQSARPIRLQIQVRLVGGGPGDQVPGGQILVVGAPTHNLNRPAGGQVPGGRIPGIIKRLPIHPDVRLKKLAFYDVLGTLIKPSTLVPRNTQVVQKAPFYFALTPQQVTEIASNRPEVEHAIQVQLRFCLVETSCDQEDCFPPNVNVKVNNELCQLPNGNPRTPCPVNVTSVVNLSPIVTNTIMVQWWSDHTHRYCLAVYLVKKLTSAQLLQRMKSKSVKPMDYTRALIKKKLTEYADCEIATTMLTVSLICPLGKMRMLLPSRASTCSHLQCFDASLYLQMNERKPTWKCPVCDKPAIYDNLIIDGYFQEVLNSSLLETTEVQLHRDGSWSTAGLRSGALILDTP